MLFPFKIQPLKSKILLVAIVLFSLGNGCTSVENKQPSPTSPQSTNVNVQKARLGSLAPDLVYTGTTQPKQIVSVRSQAEGRLLSLSVDVGDKVIKGQQLGQLDDSLLANAVREQQAELTALDAELARARIQVNNARIELERLRLELQQAKNDATRYSQLAQAGAIPRQQAETARTTAQVAQKAVNSATAEIRIEEQVVANIIGQITAQKSVIAQEQQRQAYAQLISPLTGIVVEKVSEPGNLVSTGGEVLKIGDFSQIKVKILISELDLAQIRQGETVNIKLDAFPNKRLIGIIDRIFPTTQGTARQIPIEVILPNNDGSIKSGLLARVTFQNNQRQQIIIPESAILRQGEQSVVFVISQTKEQQGQVEQRRVTVGKTNNGEVEILSGLLPQERFVVNSSKPLKDGQTVQISILSE